VVNSNTPAADDIAAPPPVARQGTVHVLDDDAELREYIRWLIARALAGRCTRTQTRGSSSSRSARMVRAVW
jgi:hypothetical protein